MTELVRLASFPGIIVAAWYLSRYSSQFARILARQLSAVPAALFVMLVISGYYYAIEGAATVHRWSGHAIVIAVWLFVPFSLGVLLQQGIVERPLPTVGKCFCLLLLLGLALLTSISGYLLPADFKVGSESSHPGDAELYNRFIVLHEYLLPVALAALLICCSWILRPHKRIHPFRGNEDATS